jgi:hypothetical protein
VLPERAAAGRRKPADLAGPGHAAGGRVYARLCSGMRVDTQVGCPADGPGRCRMTQWSEGVVAGVMGQTRQMEVRVRADREEAWPFLG